MKFRIRDPVYNGKVWVHYGPRESVQNVWPAQQGTYGFTAYPESGWIHCWVGYIRRWPLTIYQHSVVAHELHHVAEAVMEQKGVDAEGEVMAYYVDFLTRETLKNLRDKLE